MNKETDQTGTYHDINDEHEWKVNEENKKDQTKHTQEVPNLQTFSNPFIHVFNPRRRSLSQNSNFCLPDQAQLQSNYIPLIIRPLPEQLDRFHSSQQLEENKEFPIQEQVQERQKEDQNKQQEEAKEPEIQNDLNEQNDQDDEDDGKTAALYTWVKEHHEFSPLKTKKEILKAANDFKIIESNEEIRTDTASKGGGKQCQDKILVKTIRKIGKSIIKEVGKKLLTGNFNLTQVAFPIRAMIPKSALEKGLGATCFYPLYLNKAAQNNTSPLERVKLVLTATIANFYINCSFLKPLNPILGETISGRYPDGTQLYGEQISHHPPVSYFQAYGENYRFYGYYLYEAKAGLNSLTLKNKGKRVIEFKNNQKITYNFASEEYSGSFWGTMKVEAKGKLKFVDEKNEIEAEISFNNVSWKASDYFSGDIKVKGKKCCKIYGTYMGFIEFDKVRYWDYRYVLPFQVEIDKPQSLMLSDHSFRKDRNLLLESKLDEAQKLKEYYEEVQRQDAKLRQKQNKK